MQEDQGVSPPIGHIHTDRQVEMLGLSGAFNMG